MQHMLRMGIDVGSTTVKVVLLDEHDNYLYKKYIRHYANILDTVYTLPKRPQVGHEMIKFMYVLPVLVVWRWLKRYAFHSCKRLLLKHVL